MKSVLRKPYFRHAVLLQQNCDQHSTNTGRIRLEHIKQGTDTHVLVAYIFSIFECVK